MSFNPWSEAKALLTVFTPIIFGALVVFLFLLCIGAYCTIGMYVAERRFLWRMWQRGRYLSHRDLRTRLMECKGTLIVDRRWFGWNCTHAWWTPDDVVTTSPFGVPCEDDYFKADGFTRCLNWEKWCHDNYTCDTNG